MAFDLLVGTGWLNSPLWTLQWEVLCPLLLPLYFMVARWRPRLRLAEGAACSLL